MSLFVLLLATILKAKGLRLKHVFEIIVIDNNDGSIFKEFRNAGPKRIFLISVIKFHVFTGNNVGIPVQKVCIAPGLFIVRINAIFWTCQTLRHFG
jgi:hypothetical protein